MIRPEILTAIREQLRAVSKTSGVRVEGCDMNIDAIADDALHVFNTMEDRIHELEEQLAMRAEEAA